jgi:hypothetical protein
LLIDVIASLWVFAARKRLSGLLLAALLAGSSNVALAGPPHEANAADEPNKRKKPVEKLGERVSRGVIQEGLDTLDTPENRARLARILNSPEMREAVRGLTASLVLGVYDGLRIGSATAGDRKAGKTIREGLDRQVTPALGRLSGRVIDSTLDAALTDEHIARIQLLGESTTLSATHGFATGIQQDLGPALAATLEQDVGPALAIVLERDIIPALGRGLDTPEMQHVLGNLTHSIASEAISGAGEGIDEETRGKESGLELFGRSIAVGYAVAVFVAFALGTTGIVLTVVLVRSTRRMRKQSKSAAEREAALLRLIDNLETENPELKLDARRLLEEQLQPA